MKMENLEFVTVNYNTPDLLERLLDSFLKYGKDLGYNFRVIDGSDRELFKQKDREIVGYYDNVLIEQLGYNIHHGPGMDYALNTSNKEWCFILDSDIVIKYDLEKVIEEAMKIGKPITGFTSQVNKNGIDVRHKDVEYIHPRFFMVNVEKYKELGLKGVKFIKHGAPCIDVMNYIYKNKMENEWLGRFDEKYRLLFYFTELRGTCGRFGYAL